MSQSMELNSGSGYLTTLSSDSNDDSVSVGEQAVAITIACAFIVMVLGIFGYRVYVMHKRRRLLEDKEEITTEEGTVNDPVEQDNTNEDSDESEPVDSVSKDRKTTNV